MKWVWILFATGLEVWGDYYLKRWSLSGAVRDAVLGFSIYSIGTLGWGFLLKFESLQRAILLFTMANLVAVLLVGHFGFGERMQVREWVAAALALVVVALVEMG